MTLFPASQDGTDEQDQLHDVGVVLETNSVFLGRFTTGLWGISHAGGYDVPSV